MTSPYHVASTTCQLLNPSSSRLLLIHAITVHHDATSFISPTPPLMTPRGFLQPALLRSIVIMCTYGMLGRAEPKGYTGKRRNISGASVSSPRATLVLTRATGGRKCSCSSRRPIFNSSQDRVSGETPSMVEKVRHYIQ